MGLILEKAIKATWECDWCRSLVITDSEQLPKGWADAHCGGDPCGGTHFCSDKHHYLSQRAWEEGFETGLEAQSNYHEERKQEWAMRTCEKPGCSPPCWHDETTGT